MPGMSCDAISEAVGEIERRRWTTGEMSASAAEREFRLYQRELGEGVCSGTIATYLSARINSNIASTISEQTAEISRRTARKYKVLNTVAIGAVAAVLAFYLSEYLTKK